MNTPLYIAKRYLFSKSKNNTINIITKIATIGVIISTMALFIVLSAFSGLKSFNYQFLNTADPDIKITATKGKSFSPTNKLINSLSNKNITYYTKIIEEHALLENEGRKTAITIKGVDNNYLNVNAMDSTIFIGEWLSNKYKNSVVVGNTIANKIATIPNSFQENLKVYVPKPGKGQIDINSFNKKKVQTIGLFRLTPEMDNEYVFANISLVRELLNYKKNQITAIELKLAKNTDADKFSEFLQKKIGANFSVKTRYQLNETFYKMLNMENLFAYLIATLIGIIAFFNVIGAIIMMILDKKNNIKTLFNLGLKINSIKKIFFLQGILLTIFGLIIGLLLAFGIIVLQQKFQFIRINESLAYPVEFHFTNFFIVIFTILSLGFFAALISSSRVSKKLIM